MDLNILVEKYLDGSLSRKEKKIFNAELKKNIQLRTELSQRLRLEKNLEDYFEKRELNAIDEEVDEDIRIYSTDNEREQNRREKRLRLLLDSQYKKRNRKANFGLFLSIAAGFTIIVILGTGIIKKRQEHRFEQNLTIVVNSFFAPEKDLIFKDNNKAYSYYLIISQNDSLYQSYGKLFRENVFRNSEKEEYHLLALGIASIENNDFQSALQFLEPLNLMHSEPCDICKWYYSLALTGSGQLQKAEKNLTELIKTGGNYTREAKGLLKSINSLKI